MRTRTAALKPVDKRVIDAFIDQQPLEGKLLYSDGQTLQKFGMGGHDFAIWNPSGVIEVVSPMAVKSDEVILRALKKMVPRNLLFVPWEQDRRPTRRRSRTAAGEQELLDLDQDTISAILDLKNRLHLLTPLVNNAVDNLMAGAAYDIDPEDSFIELRSIVESQYGEFNNLAAIIDKVEALYRNWLDITR